MKFAHLADCHIGGWREPKLKELSLEVFEKAIDKCIEEYVGFVVISGDLFDTSLPSIDILKETARVLSKLKEHDISTYIIPGSHDFSPSGKSMLEVLEKAKLVENVMRLEGNKLKITEDKTGVKLAGIYGKKGGLEKQTYKEIDKNNLEKETGFKIFLFHTALEEFKPKEFEHIEGISYAELPKNFNYYAGGHVHYIFETTKEDYGRIVFPGALFPNNFAEIEKSKNGGFYIVNDKLETKYIPIKLKEVLSYTINADDKEPEQVKNEIIKTVKDYKNKIITLRIEGTLKSGSVSDIGFKEIFDRFDEAFVILKNTNKLKTKDINFIEVGKSEDIESKLIKENIGDLTEEFINKLMKLLDKEKEEGEKNIDFENRVWKDFEEVICY